MRAFQELVSSHEDWLVERTLQYARRHGYTRYSSTLLEAWRQSVAGLSVALINAIDDPTYQPEIDADADYTADPMTAFGVEQARRHRGRGTDLTLFLALLKYYRQSYLDLIADHIVDRMEFRICHDFALKMFDKIELGCNAEWQKVSFEQELNSLRMQNKELTEEKLSYLTIFETLKDPVIFADDTGRIKNMNRSACFCFTPYKTPGAIYYGQTDLREVEELFKPFVNFHETEADFPDCQLPTSAGMRRFHIKARRMIDSSERMAGIVLICIDITDYQKALQDAAQADRAKSAFLATMSHELRTPAAGILGASELLGQMQLAPNQKRYLDLIETSASTLLGVLDEVLDYSKFEEIGVVPTSEDFDLEAVIENIVKIMRYPALCKSVALDVAISQDVPRRLHGDANKLTRVLMNLLGNAVKFTQQGSIALSVYVFDKGNESDDLNLQFSVIDTGIGIDPERIGRLFTPFTQGDDTISRKFGGTGLGLAICKRIIGALGGDIGAESLKGGSHFWFRLPFGKAKPVIETAQPPAAAPGRPLSILMVEDNDVNQIIGLALLEQLGHQADLASDGDQALAMLAEKNYDLLLLDLHLPGMNGYDVAESIRTHEGAGQAHLAIIAFTADDSEQARQEAKAAGFDGFLIKPLRLGDLRKALSDHVLTPPSISTNAILLPLIDETILIDHARELGPDIAAQIVVAFCSSAETTQREIREATANSQIERLTHAVHKMKGASFNLGLCRLANLAEKLERNIVNTQQDRLEADISRFLGCLTESVTALEAFQPDDGAQSG